MAKTMSLKKAALINGTGKYSRILFSIIVNAILARILSPSDYGIVAVLTVFSTFFSTLSDMGFGVAIVQNKKLTQSNINDIFSFTVYISFGLMFIFSIMSFPIARFYNNSVYVPLSLLLSISLLFDAMNMVPNGILNRNKEFVVIAVRTVVIYLLAAAITIFLALNGFRYYALAIQAIITSFFTFLWNYVTTRPKFKFKFKMDSIRMVFNYSAYQFAFNFVNYFSRNLDNLLTGKFMGNAQLGYYNKAYDLMLYPVNNLTGVITPVLHPILSDFQHDINIIYTKYIKVFKILFCIGAFVAPFCYLGGREIISLMYGNNWQSSIVCFQLLSVAILPQMLNSSASGVFQAIGNTRLLFWNSCINTFITVVAILIGVFSGRDIISLSGAVSIAYVVQFFTVFYMLIKMGMGIRLSRFLSDILPDLVLLLGMELATILYPFSIKNIFISFISKFLFLGVIFLVLLKITGESRLVKGIIKEKV